MTFPKEIFIVMKYKLYEPADFEASIAFDSDEKAMEYVKNSIKTNPLNSKGKSIYSYFVQRCQYFED